MTDPPRGIMIVEEDTNLRSLIRYLLEREQYHVIEREDGLSAIEYIERHEPVEMILAGVYLPYRNGIEVIDAVLDSDPWKNVPVLMISVEDDPSLQRALRRGAVGSVTIPVRAEEVVQSVERHL